MANDQTSWSIPQVIWARAAKSVLKRYGMAPSSRNRGEGAVDWTFEYGKDNYAEVFE